MLVRGLLAVAILIGLVFAPPATGAADVSQQARQFIETLAAQAVAALAQQDLAPAERERRARTLLNENFAVPTIGQWVLGRHWREATPTERDEYLRLFEELIIVTYMDRFSRYSGETLTVTRAVAGEDGGDVVVFSELNRPTAAPVEVGWRVRGRDGAFKIVDVLVEGVSMGQTQRSEFASVIRNGGGSVEGLLVEMRRRVKRDG
jgi:phospholipid transport system substrate-binding protein